jgi:hypothetical protein
MIRVQSGLLLLGAALVAPTMISVDAYGQLTSEVLQRHPPLSYPLWPKLRENPEAMRDLTSPLPPPPSEQTPVPQMDATSPWQLVTSLGLSAGNPLLMTDGTVIVHITDTPSWWRLTPDINGSYVNGTWSQIARLPSGYAPRFFASAVLADGRVIVEGGEDNNSVRDVQTNLGAIYDPLADTWTPVSPPSGWANIGDAPSIVLPDGTFMLGDSRTKQQALLNASNLTWTATGSGKFDLNAEEGWTLLWDGNVLTVDTSRTCDDNSELYATFLGSWVSAGSTIQQLPDCGPPNFSFEMGPQVLLPDGSVIAFGATTSGVAHTAIFNSFKRSWRAGPDLPTVDGQNYTLADAPAALLPSGNVLFAASPGLFGLPSHFFELDYRTNTISQVEDNSDAAHINSFDWNFLVLPTGQILVCETSFKNIWIYTPSGEPRRRWAPVITAISPFLRTGSTHKLHGLQLNGLSQGASYGDDVQAATNYPLVRIINATTGHVFYARTFDHSTMGIGPEDRLVTSTHFTLPDATGIEAGRSYLYVVANGIASEPVTVYISPYQRFEEAKQRTSIGN